MNKMNFWDCDIREEQIICPYCKKEQDEDTMYNYVTCWGDDGNHKECSCGSCGKDFMVIERVERIFGTYKIAKKNKDLSSPKL